MSGNERDLNVSVPTGEEIPRPDSSASSVISRTSSPEHIEDDVFVAKQEDKTADPRKVSADVAARGIVSPKKFSGPVPQSGMRGMLIAACEIENGQETDEVSLQIKNEQLNKDTGTAPEQDFATSQEINFFNKDSSISRPSSASSTSSVAEETNRREVSFQASNEDHLLKKERSFISHSGNTTVEVVSICTQTEWSWLKDIELYQEVISRSKPEWAERTERKVSKEAPKSPSGKFIAYTTRWPSKEDRKMSLCDQQCS